MMRAYLSPGTVVFNVEFLANLHFLWETDVTSAAVHFLGDLVRHGCELYNQDIQKERQISDKIRTTIER